MRLLSLILAFSATAWAQTPSATGAPTTGGLTPQQYDQLSQRFVSTVKETQVDRQLLSQPNIQQCVQNNRIDAADDVTTANGKRDLARTCLEQAFKNSTETELNNLSDQLGLEAYGLVRSKRSQDMIQFFSTRIENALYGPNANQRTKDKTVVNHATFKDIYESVLGKNVLLEITNFCYQHVPQGNERSPLTAAVKQWKDIAGICKTARTTDALLSNGCLPGPIKISKDVVSDSRLTQPSSSTSTTSATSASAPQSIYSNISDDLQTGLNLTTPQDTKTAMTDSFNNCANYIPSLCALYTYCKLSRQTPAPNLSRYDFSNSVGTSCDTILGTGTAPTDFQYEAACVVQEKLQAFRVALQAVKNQNDVYTQLGATNPYEFARAGVETYNSGSVSADRTAVGIANISSSELKAFNDQQTKNYNDEFTREGCEQNPESKGCEKFFYNDEEGQKFRNLSLTYTAATEAEKARIREVAKNRNNFKSYLTEKGYTDLARKLDEGTNQNDIVTLAQDRFAAEREASYSAMADAFEQKQIKSTDTPTTNRDKAKAAKDQYNRSGAEFNQLLLFNNVVTSFLEVVDDAGQRTPNKDALDAELREMQRNSDQGASTALTYFRTINPGTGGSTGGGNRKIGIDTQFIDGIVDSSATTQATR